MRKLILALAMVLACERSSVADVVGVTSNVLKRVVRIVIGKASGTAFTLEVDGRHYLITAKHVVATLKDGDSTIKVCGGMEEAWSRRNSWLICSIIFVRKA